MDYEKKHKEEVVRATRLWECGDITRENLEYIFPELKESEDEKVRKELIAHCRNTRCVTEEGAERIARWIDWLEKQGEQKPVWSEEDEQHIDSLLKRLEGLCRNEFERTRFAISEDEDWLKSIKQRIV